MKKALNPLRAASSIMLMMFGDKSKVALGQCCEIMAKVQLVVVVKLDEKSCAQGLLQPTGLGWVASSAGAVCMGNTKLIASCK